MPDRAFDVGIAEQHAVTFAAGLATQGLVPFCNIYSSFMQRAYDQVIHDVAIQKLNVVFCLDRAGLAGADGATHHGAYDLAYMRCIPNMIVSAPMNEEELRNLMFTAQQENMGPFCIRYPRGNGEELAVLSIGHIGNEVTKAFVDLNSDGYHPAHYDMRFVKPLDEELLHEVFSKFKKIITVEDGCLQGGVGSAIIEFMADHGYHAKVVRLGIPDHIIEHGEQRELWNECGYDSNSIVEQVRKLIVKRPTQTIAS
jgi:1-deoxy-D-xylulose-5-phosphate synthase